MLYPFEKPDQMTTISIPVTVAEREAIRAVAEREMRDPRVQARFLLVSALAADLSAPHKTSEAVKK